VFVRVKRTKKSLRQKAVRLIRSKKAAIEDASTDFAWATSSGAIVLAVLFVVVAVALLTAREDAPLTYVDREELPPTEITVEKGARERSAASIDQAFEPKQEKSVAVTIAGCLERDEETFRLTGASGADAPTSRSWKSGFLKKQAAQIELADAVGTLNLRNHVGRRVAATGTLIDREMRARSLRLIGTCE
jgi:hypothetical protein